MKGTKTEPLKSEVFVCWLAAWRRPYLGLSWRLSHFVAITLYQQQPCGLTNVIFIPPNFRILKNFHFKLTKKQLTCSKLCCHSNQKSLVGKGLWKANSQNLGMRRKFGNMGMSSTNCCVFRPAKACLRMHLHGQKRQKHLKMMKKVQASRVSRVCMMKKVLLSSSSNVFCHFRPCECMRKSKNTTTNCYWVWQKLFCWK